MKHINVNSSLLHGVCIVNCRESKYYHFFDIDKIFFVYRATIEVVIILLIILGLNTCYASQSNGDALSANKK